MANETTAISVDECQGNMAPEDIAAARNLKDQVGDVVGYSAQLSRENRPLSDIYTFSTPALKSGKGEVKTKSRISGLQSALTPILKILNIDNKSPSSEPVKHGRTLGDKDTSVCWLADEYLPEFTLLDLTCDSTMQLTTNDSALPDHATATPVTANNTLDIETSLKQNGAITQISKSDRNNMGIPSPLQTFSTLTGSKSYNSAVHPPELLKSNGTTASTYNNAKAVDTPSRSNAPFRWMYDVYLPEITLLDVTQDPEFSPGGVISPMEDALRGENLKNTPSVEHSGEMTQPSGSAMTQNKEFSSAVSANVTPTLASLSLQSDNCTGQNIRKVSLTQDISMASDLENSGTSKELVEQNVVNSPTSAENTRSSHAANVTHDISTSSDLSTQSAVSQLSTSNMQVNANSENGEPTNTSNTGGAGNEELHTSHDTEMTSKEKQHSPETGGSANNTFTIAQSSTSFNTTTEIPPRLNKTLDISPNAENDTRKPVSLVSNHNTKTLIRRKQSSADKAGRACHVKNATFDQRCPQISRESTGSEQADLQNNSVNNNSESSFKRNGTITLSNSSSSDGLDKTSPSKVCNGTLTTIKEPKIKALVTPEITSEASPVIETANEAGNHESQPSLPVAEDLSNTFGSQSMDTENSNENTFNLDDTLDLRFRHSITSTPMTIYDLRADPPVIFPPMTNCKIFSTEQDDGKVLAAQRRLYGDAPTKPSDVPSNIVGDRKTLFAQPAAKSLLPRQSSQLVKYKPASALSGRLEAPLSGLPMTRQRTQVEALKNAADPAQGTSAMSSSYNLRATTGSRHPTSGLLRPQISSGIQRPAAQSLRLPLARSNMPADKLRAPAAFNPVVKNSQSKKRPLTRGESLQKEKREKMDDALSASTTAPCKARALQPSTSHRGLLSKPRVHGCAKCAVLEEQLKRKSEEIKKLKEELLKYSN